MLEEIKKLNTSINELWHSKNNNFKDMLIAGIAILLTACLPLVIILLRMDRSNIVAKCLVLYLLFAFSYIAISMIFTHFYVFGFFNKSRSCSFFKKLFQVLYKVFLIVGIIAEIPLIVIMNLMEFIIHFRAKKMDNLINLSLILLFNLMAILFLYRLLLLLALIIAEKISFLASNYSIDLNENFTIILLFIILTKILVDTVSRIIFMLLKTKRSKEIKSNLKKLKNNLDTKVTSFDIRENFENKILEESQASKNEALEYDLNYHKKSIYRIQLIVLITIYVCVSAFEIKDCDVISEVKDAVTSITLFMLYWDKRKKWK